MSVRRLNAAGWTGVTAVCLAAMSLSAAGCGGIPRKPVYPVSGKVLYRGQPAAHVRLILTPVGDAGPDALRPRAYTNPDGTFQLGTYASNDGAPAGQYVVSLRWPRPRPVAASGSTAAQDDPRSQAPDMLMERYADPAQSGVTITVDRGPTAVPDINLN